MHTSTRILDAILFRTTPPPDFFLQASEASKIKLRDVHPIISRVKGLFNPKSTWETVTFRLQSIIGNESSIACYRRQNLRRVKALSGDSDDDDEDPGPRRYLLRNLKEINENFSKPPCYQIKLSYTSYRPHYDDEDDYWDPPESEEAPPKLSRRVTTIDGGKDANGVPQPVTLEQFFKGHFEALKREEDYAEGYLEAWSFDGWAKQYIDAQGCLNLTRPQFRRKKVSYYRSSSSNDGVSGHSFQRSAEN